MEAGESAAGERAWRQREVIVGYDCRVYCHVDVERGEVARVVIDDGTLGQPSVVDGPRELEREGVAIAERAVWPAWEFGH